MQHALGLFTLKMELTVLISERNALVVQLELDGVIRCQGKPT